MTGLGLLVEALALAGVWGAWLAAEAAPRLGQRDYGSPVGWLAAFGAALIFGFTEVPVKVPESQAAGPLLFNAYGFISNGIVHMAIALALRHVGGSPLEWQWAGVMAAVDIMVVLILARNAVWLLGIAVGPPCWCAVGMSTSFAWGTLAFGDRPGALPASLLGLALLIGGVLLVSRASILSHDSCKGERCATSEPELGMAEVIGSPVASQRSLGRASEALSLKVARADSMGTPTTAASQEVDAAKQAPAAAEGAAEPQEDCSASRPLGRPDPLSKLAHGFAYAVGAGVADGSLTAFYQRLEGSMQREGGGETLAVAAFASYFCSFGATMLAAGLVASACGMLAAARRRARAGGESAPAPCCRAAMLPGLASGALWAGANSCSVLASHLLGMALSFPLTQTAVVFCGLLGMFVFHELVGSPARLTFGSALVVITAGAGTLSAFGRPSEL